MYEHKYNYVMFYYHLMYISLNGCIYDTVCITNKTGLLRFPLNKKLNVLQTYEYILKNEVSKIKMG